MRQNREWRHFIVFLCFCSVIKLKVSAAATARDVLLISSSRLCVEIETVYVADLT